MDGDAGRAPAPAYDVWRHPHRCGLFSKTLPRKAVRELVRAESALPTPPINNYNDDKYTDPEIAAGADWTVSTKYDGMNNYRRRNSFKSWWLGRMLNQDRSLREKMVLFWHNHFVTETNSVDNAFFCYSYNALLRQHALGNFRELDARHYDRTCHAPLS